MGGRGLLARMETGVGRGGRLALLTLAALAVMAIGASVAIGGSIPSVTTPAGGCRRVAGPDARGDHNLKRPPQMVRRSDRLVAVIATNCGRFEIRLDARRSPRIVNSFVYLARSGFYDGLLFYRVVPNFVIQGGDPRNNGTGGPGYTVTEPPPKGFRYRLGTAAMAKTGLQPSGASGSVFFIVSGSQARGLPDEYAEFGQVSEGLGTVKRIDALGGAQERPSQVVRIDSIRIKRAGS
jgi:peptidyl-prolyl cis-trans isomerase B (cyclophilin B)